MEALSIPICWRTSSKKAANQSYLNFKKSVSLSTNCSFFRAFVINSSSESLLYSIKQNSTAKKNQKSSSSLHILEPTWRSRHSQIFYHHEIWDHTNTRRRFSKRFVSFFCRTPVSPAPVHAYIQLLMFLIIPIWQGCFLSNIWNYFIITNKFFCKNKSCFAFLSQDLRESTQE